MLKKLQAFIKEHPNLHYWVAYSGGLDSQVLLDLCVKLREEAFFHLQAIHIHHGLSPHADAWLLHCQRYCEAKGVYFKHEGIQVLPPSGASLEAYARDLRYQAFKTNLAADAILLTAHHQDDQAETLVLQLLRGAGLRGLAAMPWSKSLGGLRQLRPLLDWKREDLLAYAKRASLSWVQDESNESLQYARNFLRHEVLPHLKNRWPSLSRTLARSAEHCAEAEALLEEYAKVDCQNLKGSKAQTLKVEPLLQLSPARQALILRHWIKSQGFPLPSQAKLEQIQETVLKARGDRNPCLSWASVALRRFQGELHLVALKKPIDISKRYIWDLKQPLLIPGFGVLETQRSQGQGLSKKLAQVEVRFREGGEVFRLVSGQHHPLKNYFQSQAIPPWERGRLPLLYYQNELIAIFDLWIGEPFRAKAWEEGYVFCGREDR